ncbi:hypothetical protein VEx25_0489 [Vibrio antiquarius]|uniref:Uncharacterized protein n=1 Tax=Vibrio antiquarius (strain Ex25) TaxID=150340 RepID=A0ABM9WQX8_VIBAE|nr:hypothetical protein VEx25_0489 [Vibrio antiquarius]
MKSLLANVEKMPISLVSCKKKGKRCSLRYQKATVSSR